MDRAKVNEGKELIKAMYQFITNVSQLEKEDRDLIEYVVGQAEKALDLEAENSELKRKLAEAEKRHIEEMMDMDDYFIIRSVEYFECRKRNRRYYNAIKTTLDELEHAANKAKSEKVRDAYIKNCIRFLKEGL